MKNYRPRALGDKWFDAFKTSPGRVDPRTGRLVELTAFPIARPWEKETPPPRAPQASDERRRGWSERSQYPKLRSDYAAMAPAMGRTHEGSDFFKTFVPWVFLAGLVLVVVEASSTPPKGT